MRNVNAHLNPFTAIHIRFTRRSNYCYWELKCVFEQQDLQLFCS